MAKIIYFSDKKIDTCGFRAGPAQRAFEVCKALLSKGHEVEIAEKTNIENKILDGIKLINWTSDLLINLEEKYDLAIIHIWDSDPNFLDALTKIPVAVDIYAPVMVENANYFFQVKNNQEEIFQNYLEKTILTNTRVFEVGDFFFCANDRQYFYYLGILNVLGRINPLTYNQKIIDIVETCPESSPKIFTENMLSKKYNLKDKKIFIWMSGIFPWYDADIIINSMNVISKTRNDIVFVFVGPNNPHANQEYLKKPFINTYEKTEKLGLLNKYVFFHDFVKVDERFNIYSEATAAVITYKKEFEALLCSRSRTIDCLWGELPVITTNVDYLSEKINKHKLGITVDPENKEQLIKAILKIADNENIKNQFKENIKNYNKVEYNWETQIFSLNEFAKKPFIDNNKKYVSVYGVIQDKNRLMCNLRNDMDIKLSEITRRDTTIESLNNMIYQNELNFNKMMSERSTTITTMQEDMNHLKKIKISLEKELHQKGIDEGIKIEELRDYYNKKVYQLNEMLIKYKISKNT